MGQIMQAASFSLAEVQYTAGDIRYKEKKEKDDMD